MKKTKYLLLVIILFLISFKVNAETNDGLLYEVFWGESGVNVFAADTRYGAMDYNGWQVISTTDNIIYYCIDPELYMQNRSDAVYNSHTKYVSKTDIINNSRLTYDNFEQIKLIAYYGYGYKDHRVDHTAKYWYGITQVMLWRTLRPDLNYTFKDSRYGSLNNSLYISEINEINDLVVKHNIKPSFNNGRYNLKVGDVLVLEDTNNVLESYVVNNNDYANFSIDKNKLIITAKQNRPLNVVFYKQTVNNNFMLYESNTLQDVIARGGISSDNLHLKIQIKSQDLIIKKIDKETGVFNNHLIGSVFGLYDNENNLIKEIEIKKEEEKITLAFGTYYLKELKSSKMYNLNDTVYEIIINNDSGNINLEIANELIKGNLEFTKKDYSSGQVLEGVLMGFYKDDNTLIYSGKTNNEGKIFLNDLKYGTYYFIEKETIKYYRLNEEKVYFNITENGVTVKKEMTNQKKEGTLKFIKIDKETEETLANALINVYYIDTNELVFSGKTNEVGEILLEGLIAGSYYIVEKEPPYGYILNDEEIPFELIEDNEVKEIIMANEKIEIPNTYSTNNIMFYLLFSSIVITLLLRKNYEKIS